MVRCLTPIADPEGSSSPFLPSGHRPFSQSFNLPAVFSGSTNFAPIADPFTLTPGPTKFPVHRFRRRLDSELGGVAADASWS